MSGKGLTPAVSCM